jgi:hypothetical protein
LGWTRSRWVLQKQHLTDESLSDDVVGIAAEGLPESDSGG